MIFIDKLNSVSWITFAIQLFQLVASGEVQPTDSPSSGRWRKNDPSKNLGPNNGIGSSLPVLAALFVVVSPVAGQSQHLYNIYNIYTPIINIYMLYTIYPTAVLEKYIYS